MKINSMLKFMLYLFISKTLGIVVNSQNKDLKNTKMKKLFDRYSLKGWKGMTGIGNIEDLAITRQNPKGNLLKQNTFLVWDKQLLENYTTTFRKGPHIRIQFKDMVLTKLDKISPDTVKEMFQKLSQETKNIAKY